MDPLWAPWRASYILAARPAEQAAACFLCEGLKTDHDRQNLIIRRTKSCAVVLNRFPYNNGHLLVAPRLHKARLEELATEELQDLMETLRNMVAILEQRMRPDGFNIGLNLGAAAGAGLPGHLHWHIVPRWIGDTNFMPLFADAKVISQSLDSLYDLLGPDAPSRNS